MRFEMLFVCPVMLSLSSTAWASNWGSFQADGCVADGVRQYSLVLWNIPWGLSWEYACFATPATINGVNQGPPDRCVTGVNEWGQWDVADPSCLAVQTCVMPGVCGGRAPDGCYCDDACERLGDCCPDKTDYCG